MEKFQKKRVLAISGSLRQQSSNNSILRFMKNLAPEDIEFMIFHGIGEIQHFNPDLDTDDAPAEVVAFRALLASAAGVIICTPEYAFGVPGTLKNALDWMVSSGSLVDKPVALITASTGGSNAHHSLLLTLGALSADVLAGATFHIPFIGSKIDHAGTISDEKTAADLAKALEIVAIKVKQGQ